jgi:murein DD-endopeptidase MepM/ murein hydrolase activator NlpD
VVLAAEEGAEVRAIHHGRVAYADWLRGFGLLLVIEHDDDYMTFYGHNQTLLKEPGEWVAAGETIALSGSSGGRLSPRLYFAIRHRGRPLNPEHWCRHTGGSGRKSSAISSPAMERVAIYRLQTEESRKSPGAILSPSLAANREFIFQ